MAAEFKPEDTGPIAVSLEMRVTAMASAVYRAVGLLEAADKRLDKLDEKMDKATEALSQCPLHTEAIAGLAKRMDGLEKKTSPSEEMKTADARDDALARRARRWLPILGIAIGGLGIGGGGATLLKDRETPGQNAAVVKAIKDEQSETRELLRILVKLNAKRVLKPPMDDKED